MTSKADNSPLRPIAPRSREEIAAEVRKTASERAAVRAERRALFDRVQPEPQMCIVAWVDLLGFRNELRNADTPAKFRDAYRRMRDVQEQFGKESAGVEPTRGELNEHAGKRIVALSDGLAIALNLESDCAAAEVSTRGERVGSFLDELRRAQARCAYAGNFVRGGVSLGYFWFEDDILLSPALVEAYEMETKAALNPVIVLRRDFSDELSALDTNDGNSDDPEPMDDLFRECDWMTDSERADYVMLDFMPVFLEDGNPAPFLRHYDERLIEARAAAPDKDKSKYDWLIKYAREFVASNLPSLSGPIFGAPLSGTDLLDKLKPKASGRR